jgi:hypothetical protein
MPGFHRVICCHIYDAEHTGCIILQVTVFTAAAVAAKQQLQHVCSEEASRFQHTAAYQCWSSKASASSG